MIKHLRRAGLIEGRRPNLHVSALIAKATASKADYIRTRAQDDAFHKKLILDAGSGIAGRLFRRSAEILGHQLSLDIEMETGTGKTYCYSMKC